MFNEEASTNLPEFTSVPCKSYHSKIFNYLFSLVSKIMFSRFESHPEIFQSTKSEIPFKSRFPFSLQSSKIGMSEDQVIRLIDSIVEEHLLLNRNNPLGEGLQVPLDPVGFIADVLGTVLSSPPVTYLFAPLPTLMEKEVIRGLINLLNYEDGKGDGIFLPGGGFAHICAIKLAIHQKYPRMKELGMQRGLNGEKPCVFVSTKNYHGIRKACILSGMEKDSCIPVPLNKVTSSMDADALENAINVAVRDGLSPLLVVATLGSKDSLYIDPLTDIHRICSNLNIWFHVDGSVGGPLIFSKTWRDSGLKGIGDSDSFTLGMETLLGSPPCSVCLVTKHDNLCNKAFAPDHQVYERESKLYDTSLYDRGCNTPLTSRRADVLKMWLMWKFYGTAGLGSKVDLNIKHKLQIGNSKLHKEITCISEETFIKTLETIKNNSLYFETSDENPIRFLHPEELKESFDFGLQDSPLDNPAVMFSKIIDGILKFSNRIPHPKYIFHLTCGGLDPYGIVGDILCALTHETTELTSDITEYRMEQEIFLASRKLVGYSSTELLEENRIKGFSPGNGLICAGATCVVMASMFAAKSSMFPDQVGNQNDQPFKIFVSKNAHSCFQKAATMLGLGLNNVVEVEVDENGKMSVPALREAIIKSLEKNEAPFFVGATAGTTVQGVFDPISEIAEVCKEFGVWLHVDGSFGGSAIFSPKFKRMHLNGLHLANSFSYNPHKWFGLPTECSVLLFRDDNVIRKTFGQFAGQPGPLSEFKLYSGVQTGRRNNVLKFWMTWKAKGLEGLRKHIEYSYALKDCLVAEISRPERRNVFRLWKNDFETPAVLFQYIPKYLRHLKDFEASDVQVKLGKVAELLHDKLIKDCSLMLGMHNDGHSQNLLRIVLMSSGVTNDNILSVLNDIDKHGEDISL